jgi:hypothetical protein
MKPENKKSLMLGLKLMKLNIMCDESKKENKLNVARDENDMMDQ